MLTESEQTPSILKAIGRPAIWSTDSRLQREFVDLCANIAIRHENVGCAREARGIRCWNCRPLLMVVRTPVARHYATFQRRPDGAQ